MSEKKYELIKADFTQFQSHRCLCRIKALRDFGNVKAGELGGYVEGYHNLSQNGNCWIYDNALVCDNAEVINNATVKNDAEVIENAMLYGHANVFGNVIISGHASVHGNSMVCGHARIEDEADIHGNAAVCDDAVIMHNSIVYGSAKIYGYSKVVGDSVICEDADISSNNDYLYIKGLGSMNRSTTAFKLSDGGVYVNCGCYHGTLDAFEMRVNEAHGDNKYGKEYKMLIDMCKLHFGLI